MFIALLLGQLVLLSSQVRDPDGDVGWVHRSLLSRARGVVVTDERRSLRRRAESGAAVVAFLEPRVVAELVECSAEWCEVSVRGYSGYLRHDQVWGVYAGEIVE